MDLTLLLAFLQAVLGVVSNNTLSQSKKDQALGYFALIAQIVRAKGDVNRALTLVTERIASGEPISDADFDALKTRSDKAHEQIQKTDDPPPDKTV